MSWDPMSDAIAEKQLRAHRNMYDPMEVARWDRNAKLRIRKDEFLDLLKTDSEFREEVKKILNS